MRTVRYKVWDNELKEFSNYTNRDPFLNLSTGQVFFWDRALNDDGSPSQDIVLQDTSNRFTLLQYTGIKDKDGIEICEGDIISCKQFYYDKVEDRRNVEVDKFTGEHKVANGHVWFFYLDLSWNVSFNHAYSECGTSFHNTFDRKVIGNIFESEQLLKS